MNSAELKIAKHGTVVDINVSGRANFVHGTPLRDFAGSMIQDGVQTVRFFMSGCMAMDSTFMGALSMIALHGKKGNIKVQMVNITDNGRQLLKGLGVEKLFDYVAEDGLNFNEGAVISADTKPLSVAESVVEAHETLMNVDADNVAKFEKVVEFAKNDLEKMRNK